MYSLLVLKLSFKNTCELCFLYFILDWIGAGSSPRLLDWDSVQHKLPWNVVILLGSGFALAEAAEVANVYVYTCSFVCVCVHVHFVCVYKLAHTWYSHVYNAT